MRFLRFPLALPIFHPVTLCRSRSPDLDLFAIRRSQTTEVEIRLFLPYLRSTCARPPSVGQDRLILTCLPSVLDLFANNWHVCQLFGDPKLQALIGPSIDMKVLTDLEKRRDAFSIDIKVPMDLKRSLLCIQSRFPNAPPPANPRRVSLARRNIRKATPLQVCRTCMSIARRTEKNPKVRRSLMSIARAGSRVIKVR